MTATAATIRIAAIAYGRQRRLGVTRRDYTRAGGPERPVLSSAAEQPSATKPAVNDRTQRRLLAVLAAAMLASALAHAQAGSHADPLAREIFRELVEINTTDTPAGNVTAAADAMAARLRAGGFAAADVQVLGPNPRKHNLVARYRGKGTRRPILLLAHLDVVAARREDWTTNPFTFLEKDGYFYGRGTTDDKSLAAHFVAVEIAILLGVKGSVVQLLRRAATTSRCRRDGTSGALAAIAGREVVLARD